MKKIIFIIIAILLLNIVSAQDNVFYSIKLNYDGESLTNTGLKLISDSHYNSSNNQDLPLSEGFLLKVVSFDNEILYTKSFSIDIIPIMDHPEEIFNSEGHQMSLPEEEFNPSETEIVITTPYFENAKSIQIFDKKNRNNLILTIDISGYSKKPSISMNGNYLWTSIIIIIVAGVIAGVLLYKYKLKPKKKSSKKKKKKKNKSSSKKKIKSKKSTKK